MFVFKNLIKEHNYSISTENNFAILVEFLEYFLNEVWNWCGSLTFKNLVVCQTDMLRLCWQTEEIYISDASEITKN